MLLSIIIPVYNVEDYIVECLDSIVHQLLPNTELIIIDDFSKDATKTVLKNYLYNLNDNIKKLIKLISLEENKGVGHARTVGVSSASGKYIGSIDPDDIISSDYIEKIINILQNISPDIIQFDISRFESNINEKYILSSQFLTEGLHPLNSEIKSKFYEQNFWSFCSRIIKKDLFLNIDFSSLRNCEDVYALPLIFSKAENIYILQNDLYFYRLNFNSLSKSELNIENSIKAYKFIINRYLKKAEKDPDIYIALVPIVRGYIQFCLKFKGYISASLSLVEIRKEIKLNAKRIPEFNKISHKLFILFGVNFLVLMRLIGR